jgi:UDP-glucose:(heptosyl)LPS alpha-1,3-glucosyltransferase
MGLEPQMLLVGKQQDVRPYLWASDFFVLPSYYETFSLATFEAAAAGLPVLVPRLSGVEDFLRDGKNGFQIELTPEAVADGIHRICAAGPAGRQRIGDQARRDVALYETDKFADRWREIYARFSVA